MCAVPILIGVSTAATTFVGGHHALYWRHKLNGLLGFGAGAVSAAALFDLLPEAIHLNAGPHRTVSVLSAAIVGFLFCFTLFRIMPAHTHEDDLENGSGLTSANHQSPATSHRNLLGVGSLPIHSLLDGLEIGLALKVSMAVGIVAAIGVLVHDFSDGINTVAIVLRNNGDGVTGSIWK